MIEIIDKQDCCGCNACVQKCPRQCIRMEIDDEGFEYPVVNKELCVNCHLCEKVCPHINDGHVRRPTAVYAIRHPNNRIQLQSSSGGAFSLIAEWIIQQEGVVFGAIFDDEWNVIHGYTETLDGLVLLRMSKYVQSRIDFSFKCAEKFLKEGRSVMFVGTPCQIHGLKLFLRKDYENLITVDFVCHGVPSPKVWRSYLNGVARRYNIESIAFRDKRLSWEKFCFALQFKDKKKEVCEDLRRNSFLRGFIHDIYLRPSCYNCKNKCFKSGSDFTLADFWGIKNIYPELYDKNGVSCLMVNSHKGMNIFSVLNVHAVKVEYDKVLQYNHSIEYSVKQKSFRNLFFYMLNRKCIPLQFSVFTIQCLNKLYGMIYK